MIKITSIVFLVLFLSEGLSGWSYDIEDQFILPQYSTKKIFMDLRDVALTDILKIFSKQSNMNFVAAPEVANRRVTLYLNGVGFYQALTQMLDANGLVYATQPGSNIFVVRARPTVQDETRITKVYQLKYATVSGSRLNSTISVSPSTTFGASSSSPGLTTTSSSGLEDAVRASLSSVGRLMEDVRTNSLVITDIPEQFATIEKSIADLDVPVPQILIEVQMIDVSKSLADQLGVTYGANLISFAGAAKAVDFPFSRQRATPTTSNSSSGSALTTNNNGSFTPGQWSAQGFTAVLNFLSTKTDAHTLARPRILTLNNQTARIEISTNQAISIEQTQTSSTTSGTTVSGNTVERFTTGVILRVTPQANLTTREITLAVSPRVISVILSQVQPPGSTSTSPQVFDPQTTGSDSILKLRDGQTMVIGGLMTTQTNSTLIKLPFLGDLPFIGHFFRSTNKTKSNRELIIFLTPHIIDEYNQEALKPQPAQTPKPSARVNREAQRMQVIDQALNSYDLKKN